MIDKVKILAAFGLIAVAIFLYYQFADLIQIARVGIVIIGVMLAAGAVFTTEAGQTAWAFMKGANIERKKVIWPTYQEASMVTLWVIILVIILGLLMWVFDALSFYTIYDVILRVRS